MAEPSAVYGVIRVGHGSGELRVNDIPIYRTTIEDGIRTFAIPIHEYLVDGENTIKLIAIPPDPEAPGAFEAQARVARFREGEFLNFEEGEGFAHVVWEPSLGLRPIAQRFAMDWPHRWVWESAPEIALDESVRSVLDDFVAEMHAAYLARDPEPILARMAIMLKETADAYPPPMEAGDGAELREGFARDWPVWSAVPFAPHPENYRLAADGRLVECVGPDGLALIRNLNHPDEAVPDLPYFPVPMMVAFKGGEPVIVR